MAENLDKPLKVSELSARVGISECHFHGLFKTVTGRSPISLFIDLRMNCALNLLRETSLSVKEVSALLGYRDQFYFSRIFKSVHGMSPKDCRVTMSAARYAQMRRAAELFRDTSRGLKEIANSMGFRDLAHFSRLLKNTTGAGPRQCRAESTRMKMDQARRLLQDPGATVKDVATSLGFRDPFYFSRVFKSVYGVSPSASRAPASGTSAPVAAVACSTLSWTRPAAP